MLADDEDPIDRPVQIPIQNLRVRRPARDAARRRPPRVVRPDQDAPAGEVVFGKSAPGVPLRLSYAYDDVAFGAACPVRWPMSASVPEDRCSLRCGARATEFYSRRLGS
jgi:hypothetical protein